MTRVCSKYYQPVHKRASERKSRFGDEKDQSEEKKKEYMGKGSGESDRKAPRERQEAETQGKVAELGAKEIGSVACSNNIVEKGG